MEKIRQLTWLDIYQSEDVDEAVNLLTTRLNRILDKMAPIKTFQTNSKYCPWISGQTKLLMLERNKLCTIEGHLSCFNKLSDLI